MRDAGSRRYAAYLAGSGHRGLGIGSVGRLFAPFRWFVNTRLARSLRFRLVSLVLLASLPALALLFLTASQQRNDALRSGQGEADRIAQVAASDQGREIDRVQRELSLLGRLPEVHESSGSDCTELFASLVNDPDSPFYVDLRVLNPDGSVFCRSVTADPFGIGVEEPFVRHALDGQAFTIGDYQVQQSADRAVLSFAAPVRNADNDVIRVIIATLSLGSQSTFLTQSSLPNGAILSIVAQDGTLLLQRPPQEGSQVGDSLLGTPVVDEVTGATPVATGQLDFETRTREGYVTAFEPIVPTVTTSVDTQALVIVQLPEQEIVRSANDAFRNNVGKLGVAAAVVVFAAWVSADLFVSRDIETRKSVVAELYHAFSSGAVEHLESIIADNFVDHSPAPGQAKGVDGLKQNISAFRTAFPDGEIVPREMIADRDKVVARVSLTGTQLAEYMGVPASGKRMIADGAETYQFRQGVISEGWSLFGPLVEVSKLMDTPTPEVVEQPKRSVWSRLFGRGGKGRA